MRKKIQGFIKKYQYILVAAIILLGIGCYFVINHSDIKNLSTTSYSLQYDKSWKIKKKSDDSILLKHSSNSKLKIELLTVEDEYRYSSISDMIDEIIYSIESQNNSYQLISKKQDSITENKYDGYKMLYENGTSQVMVTVFKRSDKLVLFTYEASNEYFDILLDSVQNIIYHFNIKDEKFDLSHQISLDISSITYSEEQSIISLLKDTSEHEIAYKNYYVNYSIPSNFEESSINSTSGYYNFEGLESGMRISLSVNILNRNIYEYLDRDNRLNLYDRYSVYQEDESYADFKEEVSKLDSNYDSYIYKNSYYHLDTFDSEKKLYENIILIYALNRNHILTMTISSSGIGIPKDLIEMIKINSSKNYASYIKVEKQDGNLIGTLKRFTDYNKDKIDEITLKVPEKYEEIEKDTNIYENRYYGLNYDEENEMYNYEIEYNLTSKSSDIDSLIKNINSSFSISYGEYNYLTLKGNFTLNEKSFTMYEGGYTTLSGVMFTNVNRNRYYIYKKVLFYELSNGGYLVIKVSGNGNEISDDILNEVTNFDIETKNY